MVLIVDILPPRCIQSCCSVTGSHVQSHLKSLIQHRLNIHDLKCWDQKYFRLQDIRLQLFPDFHHGLTSVNLQTVSRPSSMGLAASLVLLVLWFQCLGLRNCWVACLPRAGGRRWTVHLPTMQINQINNLLYNYTLSAAVPIAFLLWENAIRAF